MPDERSDEERLRAILDKDSRYHREAYVFVSEALAFTARRKGRKGHVTGKELLLGARDLARDRFGLMARTVLDAWGVHRTEDFGEIVFNMVDEHLMSKQDSDSRQDFAGVYDFKEAFDGGIEIKLEE